MRIDPYAEAVRLLAGIDQDFLPDLAADPLTTIELLFEDLTVKRRPPSPPGSGCAVDGTYHPGPQPRILVADDVTPARQRFTLLHELGHHLIENDDRLNDLEISDRERRDEDICNEVAAAVLLPKEVVDAALPAGKFTAKDVAALYDERRASRMACCVAAARRLRRPGCVILGSEDGTADFTAHHPATAWRIARGTQQGDDSILASAARSATRASRGVTSVRFASGHRSGNMQGDAYQAEDGWVFAVIVDDTHAPWGAGLHLGLTDTGAPVEEIECIHCGEVTKVWTKACAKCGDRVCWKCNRCSCPVGPAPKVCQGCHLLKGPNLFQDGSEVCVDCE
jgi:hypothetical protein